MFIKKVTNNKNGIAYLTYRLVKSQRIEGIPKHINILKLGSLPEILLKKHKVLADRIEQLMRGDTLLFSNLDDLIEEWAYFYYLKLIKNSFSKSNTVNKHIDNKYIGELFPVDLAGVQQVDNIQRENIIENKYATTNESQRNIPSHEI